MANHDQMNDNQSASGAHERQHDKDRRSEELSEAHDGTDSQTDPDRLK